MFKVVLQRDAALGNGTRLRGHVLGTVSGVAPAELVELAQATPGKSLRDLAWPEGSVVSLAADVESCELITAVRNGDLVAYVDDAILADLDEDSDDMGDFPEAGAPTVSAAAPAKKTAKKVTSAKKAKTPPYDDDPTAGRR